MKVVEGYLELRPRLSTGAVSAMTKAANDSGRKAGQAMVDGIKASDTKASQAGKQVGKSAGESTVSGYRDSAGKLRDVNGRFLKDGESSTKRAAESAGRKAGDSYGVGLKSTLGPLRLYGSAVIGGFLATGLAAAAKMGISAVSNLQQAQIAFTTLSGSATAANKEIKDLQQFAANTPFDFLGLEHSANLLMGAGAQMKDIIPIMRAWGDASGALGVDNDHFNSAMIALSQSMSAGRINAQDMNQIVQAGIPIWKIMGEALGMPVAKVRDLSEQGKLLSNEVLPKVQAQMEKDYGGSMAKQSKTLAGVWSNLMDSMNIGLAKVLMPLAPILQHIIPTATGAMTGALSGAVTVMKTVITGVESFVYSLKSGKADVNDWTGVIGQVGVVLHNVGVFVVAAGRTAWPVLKVAIGSVYAGFKTLLNILQPVTGWLAKHASTITTIALVVGGLVLAYKAYATIMAVSKAATVAYYTVVGIVKGASSAWEVVQWALNVALDANPIGLVVLAIAALIIAIIAVIKWHKQILSFFKFVWGYIWGFLKTIGAWFAGPFVNFFVQAGKDIAAPFVALWKGMVSGAKAVGSWFAGPFVGFFVNLGHDIAAPFIWVYDKIVKPVFGFIVNTVKKAISTVQSVIAGVLSFFKPVFNGAAIVAGIFGKVLEVVFGLVRVAIALVIISIKNWVGFFTWAFGVLKAGAMTAWNWLWSKFIGPAINGAKVLASWFTTAIHTVVGWLNWLVAKGQQVWNGLWAQFISPAVAGFKTLVSWVVSGVHTVVGWWNWLVAKGQQAWNWIWATFIAPAIQGVRVLAGWFNTGVHLIGQAWDWVVGKLSAGWNWVKVHVFDWIANVITKDIPGAFSKGVGFISSAWEKVKNAAKEPVKFVIDTVINHGLIDGFNTIAKAVHVKGIDYLKMPKGFADGGYTGSGGKYTPKGPVHGGEFVIPRDKVSQFGVDTLNRTFLGRNRKSGDGSQGVGVGYADGGLVGWLSKSLSTLTDPVGSVKKAINALIAKVPGGGKIQEIAKAAPTMAVDELGKWIGGHFGSGGASGYSGPITPNIKSAQDFIKSQNHKPYVWAGAGPGGADCSGFVSEVYNILSGKKSPWGHTFSTSNEAPYFPLSGHGAFTAGWANPGERGGGDVGHTAGNLAGLAFESGGAGGDMHYGAGSTSVDSFAHVGHMKGYDRGGILPAGGLGVNVSGKPEMVRSASQEDELNKTLKAILAELRGGGNTKELHFHDKADIKTYVQTLAMQRGLSA